MIPKIKFNAILPEKLGGLVGKNWDGVTLPGIGIFFKKSKKDVSLKLAKHEFFHFYQGENTPLLFFAVIFLDYKLNGYDKSLLESAAKKYADSGPLTAIEQAWWDAAK